MAPMKSSIYGQCYVLRIEDGGDQRFTGYRVVRTTKALYNVRKLLSSRGALNYELEVLAQNNIASVFTKLKVGTPLRIPDKLRTSTYFVVLAGDTGPVVQSGYARISTVPRSERAGLSVFSGYDPIVMSVPIRFEAEPGHGGPEIEEDIAKLEQMAGRGNFGGSAVGAPPRIRFSTVSTDNSIVNLIPANYQWSENNTNAPIWWISGISWEDDAWRDHNGNRIRQKATLELTQFVRPDVLGAPSASERAKTNQKAGKATTYRGNIAVGSGQIAS